MKRLIAVLMVALVMMVGCGGLGKTARTIPATNMLDSKAECEDIQREATALKADYEQTKSRDNTTDVLNGVCAVTGVFLLIPFAGLDLSGTDTKELDQIKLRYKTLQVLAEQKGCMKIHPLKEPTQTQNNKTYNSSTGNFNAAGNSNISYLAYWEGADCERWKCEEPKYRDAKRVFPNWSEDNPIIEGHVKYVMMKININIYVLIVLCQTKIL